MECFSVCYPSSFKEALNLNKTIWYNDTRYTVVLASHFFLSGLYGIPSNNMNIIISLKKLSSIALCSRTLAFSNIIVEFSFFRHIFENLLVENVDLANQLYPIEHLPVPSFGTSVRFRIYNERKKGLFRVDK